MQLTKVQAGVNSSGTTGHLKVNESLVWGERALSEGSKFKHRVHPWGNVLSHSYQRTAVLQPKLEFSIGVCFGVKEGVLLKGV